MWQRLQNKIFIVIFRNRIEAIWFVEYIIRAASTVQRGLQID